MKRILRPLLALLLAFALPNAAAAVWWTSQPHPAGWRAADWSSSGLLPRAADEPQAALYVLSARTGGLKGAVATHAWIVLKDKGGAWERYDKVGWGMPVRRDGWAADGRWYSNTPVVVAKVTGPAAEPLVARARAAIAAYPFAQRGDYTLWPGPNSNTLVAHVLRALPGLDATLPPTAIGKDFRVLGDFVTVAADWRDVEFSLGGVAGLALGARHGVELRLLGLTLGLDLARPALKLPGVGRVGW